MEFIHTFFGDIRRIEAKYLKNEVGKKEAVLVDSFTFVDIEELPVETPQPTLANGNSSTSCVVFSITPSSTASPLSPISFTAKDVRRQITQHTLLEKGNLDHSIDHRATKLEASIPVTIKKTFNDVMTTLTVIIDALISRIEVCEQAKAPLRR